jgi:glycosyltransferase involved in cell wall biosynthesis
MKALELFADRRRDVQVLWTHMGDGPVLSELVAMAEQVLSSNFRIRFTGGLANAQVMDFYREHPVDVFVNVSASEGLPVSIMEAQSFGIPIVATAVGGIPEIVTEQNGHLLPPNPSLGEIAAGLQEFVPGTPSSWIKRQASKAMWRARFNAPDNYMAFINELSGIVHAKCRS